MGKNHSPKREGNEDKDSKVPENNKTKEGREKTKWTIEKEANLLQRGRERN